ncbi:hypothetical protein D3C81_975950 [compost metagenome]
MAADSGWMKGCMSEVFMSSFSYQVAVGRTMSEYTQVEDMRKSRVVTRSSLPMAPSSTHSASCGLQSPTWPMSSFITPLRVPSRYLSMYSWPLPDEPSRLERQMNMLRGKLTGLSGCSQANRSEPSCQALTT